MPAPLAYAFIKPILSGGRRGPFDRVLLSMIIFLVRRMRHLADIYLRQQYKNECLDKADKQTEWHQQHRNTPVSHTGDEMRDRFQDLLVRKHVGKQTNAQRKRPDQITD